MKKTSVCKNVLFMIMISIVFSQPALALAGWQDELFEQPSIQNNQKSHANSYYFTDVQAGETVVIGQYEQDNDPSNGKEPVEWIALAKEKDKILVISKYVLDAKPYNISENAETFVHSLTTWETCSLRERLNNIFLNEVFDTYEKNRILETSVTADKNYKYGSDSGNETQDKLFLLNITEVNKYYITESERLCEITAYAKAKLGSHYWWLRTPGFNQLNGACVNRDGTLDLFGMLADLDNGGVRPAMWISLEE